MDDFHRARHHGLAADLNGELLPGLPFGGLESLGVQLGQIGCSDGQPGRTIAQRCLSGDFGRPFQGVHSLGHGASWRKSHARN